MNILGMGPLEILLIVVLALIVFGPAKLPEIMGQVGRAIAEFRRTTSQLSDEFNRTIQAELQETRAMVDDTRAAVTGVHTTINSAISTAPAPVRTAAPASETAATSVAANGTNGASQPRTEPALANTSQWSWETSSPAPTTAGAQAVPAPPPAPASSPSARRARRETARDELLPPY
jgi:TatA/E family protein of Tat protein translocase